MLLENGKTFCKKAHFLADYKNLRVSVPSGTLQDTWNHTGNNIPCLFAFPIHFLLKLRRKAYKEKSGIICLYVTHLQLTE